MSSVKDALLSVPAGLARGFGGAAEIPAYMGNLALQGVGYEAGKLYGATPEQLEKLKNNKFFLTGNTTADAVAQSVRAIATGQAGEDNPVTGWAIHDPQTGLGRLVNATAAGVAGGPATGLGRMTGAATGLGSQALAEETDNNPLAAIAGGVVGAAGGHYANAAGRYAGAGLVSPLTASGREGIVRNVLTDFQANKLLQGGHAATEIVPGSVPTAAELHPDSPGVAKLQDTLATQSPAFAAALAQRQSQNNAARNTLLRQATGTTDTVAELQNHLDTYAEKQFGDPNNGVQGELFKNKATVDPLPVVGKIGDILAGSEGQRPAVKNTMEKALNLLTDDSGKTITDPETLYHSVRKGLGDLMDKTDPDAKDGVRAMSSLRSVQGAVDDAIEQGAPGYKQYLNDYSQLRQPIAAQQYLQKLFPEDKTGNLTRSQVENKLIRLNNDRSRGGVNDAKSVAPEQIDAIRRVRDDLLRQENANPRGVGNSYTAPRAEALNKLRNLVPDTEGYFNSRSRYTPRVIGGAVGTGAGYLLGGGPVAGGVGALIGERVGEGIHNIYQRKALQIYQNLHGKLLDPSSYSPVGDTNSFSGMMRQGAVPP